MESGGLTKRMAKAIQADETATEALFLSARVPNHFCHKTAPKQKNVRRPLQPRGLPKNNHGSQSQKYRHNPSLPTLLASPLKEEAQQKELAKCPCLNPDHFYTSHWPLKLG